MTGDPAAAPVEELTPAQEEAAIELQVAAVAVADDDAVEFHPLPEGASPHESPWTMTVPLVILAVLSLAGGLLNLPFPKSFHVLETWLEPVFEGTATELELSTGVLVGLLAFSAVVAVVGTLIAAAVYLWNRIDLRRVLEPRLFARAWNYDAAISRFVAGPGRDAFDATASFDRDVVDGAVNGVGGGALRLGQSLRTTQDGYVRRYALAVGVGTVLILAFMFTRVVA